jgi:putative MATE family efflux protein
MGLYDGALSIPAGQAQPINVFTRQPMDREILRLALPAFGALVAEPMFLLADSAMVGHLGEEPLAGLGLAGAILQTIIGLMVFLAYNTTPAVARWLGAGDGRRAVAVGIDGLWFALGLGIVLAGAGWVATPALVAAFGANAAVSAAAVTYLGISMAGLPAMLLVFAASGLLRGLQDTRTPLVVAGVGFAVNIVLNFWFIYGMGYGIAGSATGSVVAQWLMVAAYLVVVSGHARREGATLWPRRAGMLLGATAGGWLFLRTLTMRIAMVLAVYVATGLGSPQLAAFQIVMTLFATLAFALDALAIATQALVGRHLGAGDRTSVKAVLRRCLEWGVLAGLLSGAFVVLGSGVLGRLFTNAATVLALLPPSLVMLGLSVPIGAVVWVLDGVLIGAGDLRYLAVAGVVNLAVFVPLAVAVIVIAPAGTAGLGWLTAAFVFGFLGARFATLGWRVRHDRWMVVGPDRSRH